jgi:two-component system response regulator AtoC
MDPKILAVDDEQDFLDSLKRGLITAGFKKIYLERDPLKAVTTLQQGASIDIALIDITMPEMTGLELLEFIKCHSPGTECIMITAANEARLAVECLKKGAYDYLLKPVSRDDLIGVVNRALERKRLLELLAIGSQSTSIHLKFPEAFQSIVTNSLQVLKILKQAELHAASNVPVLITGESGTGKELLAQAIHAASPRAGAPFTPVNMAALVGSLFDAEFFGHAKGAFTGADRDRQGYLEYSNGGTIFLDEIGILAPELQGKLLRVLQEGEYFKLGTNRPQKVDVRFIAATNADLDELQAKELFRKDLFFRLRGAWLHLPPLRERPGDIPLLVRMFLEELGIPSVLQKIDENALDLLMAYDYPGNIRELKSILQAAVNLAQDQPLSVEVLPSFIRQIKMLPRLHPLGSLPPDAVTLAAVEKYHLLKLYEQTGRNKVHTCQLLEIGLNTLRRKLKSYGID